MIDTQIEFNVYLIADYADMMPTNVTANVTFGDSDLDTREQFTLLDQYLPGIILSRSVIYLPISETPFTGSKTARTPEKTIQNFK